MPNINWEMMTQFIFPEELGIAEEVVAVEIIPRWQQKETEDSIRLTGIYHIRATVRFNPEIKSEYSEGTFIEYIDLNGDEGYFEYSMPFEVDLPREKVAFGNQPELTVDDISFFVYDGSSCTFKWEVKCKFEEPVEGALFQVESEPKKELVEQVVATASKIAEVAKVSNEELPPLSLEQQLVNDVLQQSIVESSSKDFQATVEKVPNEQTSELTVTRSTVENTQEQVSNEQISKSIAETRFNNTTVENILKQETNEQVSESPVETRFNNTTVENTLKQETNGQIFEATAEATQDRFAQAPKATTETTLEKETFEQSKETTGEPLFESLTNGPHLAPLNKSNFIEEAKTIRKETESISQNTNQQVLDEKWHIPSDADDFYNELTESYNLFKFR